VTDSGWFADPGGKVNTYRWWNGEAWTRWLSADPGALDPGAEPGLQPATSTAPDSPPSGSAEAATPRAPGDRAVRLPTAAAIVAGALLLMVVAVGATVSFTADRPLTGPPAAPPPPTPFSAKIGYDPVSRKVSFEEMQFVAPGRPFTCDTKPAEVAGIFTSAFGCFAVVHRNYDKSGSNWATAVAMGALDEPLQAGGDVGTIASRTFNKLLPPNYGTTTYRVQKRKIQPLTDIAPAGRAVQLSAEVHVSKAGLASTYDRVVLIVVRLESGRHVAWYALRANDSPRDVVAAFEASAGTITARK
jgi:hypothetical protein